MSAFATSCATPSQPAVACDLLDLILRMRNRDESALASLYDATVNRVFSVALRICGNRQDAEEIACDTYRQAWQTVQSYAPERAAVVAWLSMIARSRALDCLRRRRVQQERLHPVPLDDAYKECDPESVDRFIMLFEESSLVRQALNTLPTQRRKLIGLAFLEGLSHEQIAVHTGLALGTVKSHIRRGLESLKQELDRLGLHNEQAQTTTIKRKQRHVSSGRRDDRAAVRSA